MKGTKTEMGLKELFLANSEDHLFLYFLSEKLEELNKKEEAKMIRDKALVELGHAKGIFEKMNKYLGTEYLQNWLNELENTEAKEIKEKFAYTATQYMLSKILSEKVTDEKVKQELSAKASQKYNEAKQWFEELLKSGSELM
ncbi:hypothetical protein SJAV_04460 [Sulfurisphaera javensis]|uniref:Rubrerythrin n=1 Tax=Sulfurisphaera javensis TaxID=2049879 RepID=A0AAT9GNW7_9CREN